MSGEIYFGMFHVNLGRLKTVYWVLLWAKKSTLFISRPGLISAIYLTLSVSLDTFSFAISRTLNDIVKISQCSKQFFASRGVVLTWSFFTSLFHDIRHRNAVSLAKTSNHAHTKETLTKHVHAHSLIKIRRQLFHHIFTCVKKYTSVKLNKTCWVPAFA